MKQDEFEALLVEFWKSHPMRDFWSIETEINGNMVKAYIKESTRVIVTAHHHFDIKEGWPSSERAAIARAISYLPKQ